MILNYFQVLAKFSFSQFAVAKFSARSARLLVPPNFRNRSRARILVEI